MDFRENNGEFRTVGQLTAMQNSKILGGFTFRVTLIEKSAARFELSKAYSELHKY